MNLKQALLLSLLVSKVLTSSVQADAPVYEALSSEQYKQLEIMDQPVGFFKSTNKYPYHWVYNPATNSLRQVLCGAYDRELGGNVELKKPEQLAALSPLRFSVMNMDQSTIEDVKYRGYRDTMIGQVVEEFLKTIKILPDKHFKGRLFVDEYQEAIPQKWVFANAKEFGYLRKYIQANFNLHDVKPLAQKPILILDILKNSADLTAADCAFLKTYFTVVDPSNSEVVSFFKKNEKHAVKAMALINPFKKEAISIKQNFAEKQFHKLEELCKKFSLEEYAAMGLFSLLGYVYKDQIMNWITKKAPEDFKAFHDKHELNIMNNTNLIIGGVAGTVVAALVLNYWYQKNHEKPETLPAVAYDFDDADDVVSDAVVTDELEEEILAGDFIANR